MSTFTNEQVLNLNVTQNQYDSVSLNRKSTFINIFDTDGEFIVSINTLDMKSGSDYLFLAEVLRAAELAGTIELNSTVTYKGLIFRLAAVQTSALQTGLKINVAKREDFKKSAPQAPTQPVQNQQTAIQQNVF